MCKICSLAHLLKDFEFWAANPIKIQGKYYSWFFFFNAEFRFEIGTHYMLMYTLVHCQKRGCFPRLIPVSIMKKFNTPQLFWGTAYNLPVIEYGQTVPCSQGDVV